VGKAAEQFLNNNSKYPIVNLPRPMINSDDYNFSFSGLKTALLYESQKIIKKNGKLNKEEVEMLAYEFQEAVTDVLVGKTKRAMQDLKINKLAVVGGVAANKRLREKLQEQIDGEIIIPEFKYCTDNGVKIAVAGYYKYINKEFTDWRDLEVNSNWELGRSQT
jgi:N6-L-threonylcarbamoyladenine synthase